jgi:hypothetical protein
MQSSAVIDDLKRDVDALRVDEPSHTLLLYAMGLHLRTLDYEFLRTDCLVDGGNDKKVDFCRLDYTDNVATVAQGYEAQEWAHREAPANKASDLNTAIAWLLESDLATVRNEGIRALAEELRDALKNGEITRIEVFYVHNLRESDNVQRELGTVQRSLTRMLERFGEGRAAPPDGRVQEVGRTTIDRWRRSQHEAVSVQDEIILESHTPPQTLSGAEWQATVLVVPAKAIVGLRTQYLDALFSANVRDYLGSRQASRNINKQIELTASTEAGNFFVYNNGVTMLTNSIAVEGSLVRLTGVAIINGAQTTGSLATAAANGQLGDAEVLVRVIKCNDPSLVDQIIRYNNTQNPIKAWELRVIDPIQRRIKEEFDSLGITYQLRRGSSRRRATDVHYEKLGPYLSAFYGDPIAAHKNKAELFETESRYRHLFDEHTRVQNLLFIYRLGESVAASKSALRSLPPETVTADQRRRLDYFRYGSFAFVMMHVCSEVLDLLVSSPDPNFKRRIALRRRLLLDQVKSEALLRQLVDATLGPVDAYLKDRDAYQELKVQSGVEAIATHARTIVGQVDQLQPGAYEAFKKELVIAN